MIERTINPEDYKQAVSVALPCECHAPIAYTAIFPLCDGDSTEDHDEVGLILFKLDLKNDKVYEIYNNIPYGVEQDDLNMICTRCGASWVSFNPLFFG